MYRHDLDLWCAIRPLDNSFSLVPESTIKMVREGVAEVVVADARAWVGTHHGAVAKPLWQIKLRKGELVSVIGEISYPDPAGHSTIWYQIQPPPGEFRWVHQSDLKGLVFDLPKPERRLKKSKSELRSAALPRPDLNTRDDRVIGTGLRRVARQEAAANQTPRRNATAQVERSPATVGSVPGLVTAQVRSASHVNEQQPAIDQNVRSAEFESSDDEPGIALATATQDLVLPQNRDGINEGWRPVTRRLVSKPQVRRRHLIRMPPTRSPISAHRNGTSSQIRMDPLQTVSRVFSQSTSGFQSPVGSFADAPIRVADAMPTAQSMAAGLNFARNTPVTQTYTNIPSSVAAIEARLTSEMLKAPSQWQLNDLQQMAGMLMQSSSSVDERDSASRLMNKIQNCQRLKIQFTGAAGSGAAVGGPSNPSFNGFSNASQLNNQPGADSKFDASGWLNELSRQQGSLQSTYVLQDDTGKITHHIQPTPGLNLARYLKTKIGVVGKRGYHQGLKLDHVLVSRVYGL